MRRLHTLFAKLFCVETPLEKDLMRLARVEYGRDWQWAYEQLIEGKTPLRGVTQ